MNSTVHAPREPCLQFQLVIGSADRLSLVLVLDSAAEKGLLDRGQDSNCTCRYLRDGKVRGQCVSCIHSIHLHLLLMASSANKSYHSSGAELGDGMPVRPLRLSGESNINSGDSS